MKKLSVILFITLFIAFSAFAQKDKQFTKSEGALPKVFIAPMKDGFDEFLAAALIKEKVPVKVIIDEKGAGYIVTGTAVKTDSKWYDTVFGTEKDRNQSSIKLLKVADKSVAWAGSAGDKRGFWDTAWSKTGMTKVAQRLAIALKKEYFNPKNK